MMYSDWAHDILCYFVNYGENENYFSQSVIVKCDSICETGALCPLQSSQYRRSQARPALHVNFCHYIKVFMLPGHKVL